MGLRASRLIIVWLNRRKFTRPALEKHIAIAGSVEKLIGISVSTNYAKILPYVLKANLDSLDAWVVVTSPDDNETLSQLAGLENITLLFWDPHTKVRKFDLGGGIRKAQEYAYTKYPNSWYLRLDSDICLPQGFRKTLKTIAPFDIETIYGAPRIEFGSLRDYEDQKNGLIEAEEMAVLGYFQLYFLPLKYRHSKDASWCDIEFRDLFPRHAILNHLTVSHLGRSGKNWLGDGIKQEDFKF